MFNLIYLTISNTYSGGIFAYAEKYYKSLFFKKIYF